MDEATLRLRARLWTLVLVISPIVFCLSLLSGFTLTALSAVMLVGYALFALILHFRSPASFGRHARWIALLECYILFSLISILGAILAYLAEVHSGQFIDEALDIADQAIGFRWLSVHHLMSERPIIHRLMNISYLFCFPMPLIVFALLHANLQIKRSYIYIAAYGLTLAITVAVFFFTPAKGAFGFYLHNGPGTPDGGVHFGAIIAQLRGGSLTRLDLSDMGGIVSFPSFHAAMAILFAWGAWPIRRARIPMLAANGLMWVSAIPIGGHYLVDLLGGSLIAVASILLVARACREAPPNRQRDMMPAVSDAAFAEAAQR